MTALPAASTATSGTATEGDVKTWLTNLHDFLQGLLGADGATATALATLKSLFGTTQSKSTAYTVVAADLGAVLNCTGTWSLSFTAAAMLGNTFVIAVANTGGGTITLDPNASETIDGNTTLALGPGQTTVVWCDGAALHTMGGNVTRTVDYQVFTTTGANTWNKPTGGQTMFRLQMWGAGASGGYPNIGGGGGEYLEIIGRLSDLNASETATVGAGGLGGSDAGNVGGNSTFKSWTAHGGGKQGNAGGGNGYGGSWKGVDTNAPTSQANVMSRAGGWGANSTSGRTAGDAEWGGAGGGDSVSSPGGTSIFGGNGGGPSSSATAPAGGGRGGYSGASQAGARGEIRVTCW